ncbi:hypothetical protein Ciccas_011420, partial [Cichlidogyrus casuarinus]
MSMVKEITFRILEVVLLTDISCQRDLTSNMVKDEKVKKAFKDLQHNGVEPKGEAKCRLTRHEAADWKSTFTAVTTNFFRALTLAFAIKNTDDEWEYTEEPHVSRRKEILARHPEIKKLMGHDPTIALVVLVEVFLQFCMMFFVQWYQPGWLLFLTLAYVVGATLNHSLGSAIHEIGHNLAFGHSYPKCNRVLSLVCNLPLGIPIAISYKKYHQEHH